LLQAKEEQIKSARIEDVKARCKILAPYWCLSEKSLEAELPKLKQQFTELKYNKWDLVTNLSLLIGREFIFRNVTFVRPAVFYSAEVIPNRPEIQLFDLQKEQIDFSSKLISKSNLP